ncbi:MAG: hypothetical protein AABZ74_18340 [Cyanobacteriota bacterium]
MNGVLFNMNNLEINNDENNEDIPEDLFDTDDLEEDEILNKEKIIEPDISINTEKFENSSADSSFFDDVFDLDNSQEENNSFFYPNLQKPPEVKPYDDDELLDAYKDFISDKNDNDEEVFENCYIEINEENVLFFPEWIYDAMLNKTVQLMEDELKFDLAEFVEEGKRSKAGFISLNELDEKTYRRVIKYFRQAMYHSRKKKLSTYVRKYHAIFVREFERLVYEVIKDERFLNNPADD